MNSGWDWTVSVGTGGDLAPTPHEAVATARSRTAGALLCSLEQLVHTAHCTSITPTSGCGHFLQSDRMLFPPRSSLEQFLGGNSSVPGRCSQITIGRRC